LKITQAVAEGDHICQLLASGLTDGHRNFEAEHVACRHRLGQNLLLVRFRYRRGFVLSRQRFFLLALGNRKILIHRLALVHAFLGIHGHTLGFHGSAHAHHALVDLLIDDFPELHAFCPFADFIAVVDRDDRFGVLRQIAHKTQLGGTLFRTQLLDRRGHGRCRSCCGAGDRRRQLAGSSPRLCCRC